MKSKSNRPLPQDREEFETSFDTYGYHIPNRLAHGKVDFVQMLDILKKYSDTKGEYSAADIAKDYKVDPTKMQNVLTHFQVLQVIMPKEDVEEMQTEESTEEVETTDLKSNQIAPSDSKKKVTWKKLTITTWLPTESLPITTWLPTESSWIWIRIVFEFGEEGGGVWNTCQEVLGIIELDIYCFLNFECIVLYFKFNILKVILI